MSRMERGCKLAVRNTFQNFQKIGVSLERGFLRSSGHADKGSPLECDLRHSSGLQATVKILDAQNSHSMGARPSLERETQVLARA